MSSLDSYHERDCIIEVICDFPTKATRAAHGAMIGVGFAIGAVLSADPRMQWAYDDSALGDDFGGVYIRAFAPSWKVARDAQRLADAISRALSSTLDDEQKQWCRPKELIVYEFISHQQPMLVLTKAPLRVR